MKMIYLHSFAAIPTILCIFLPLFLLSLRNQSASVVADKAKRIGKFLKVPHFFLIVSLITGLLQTGFNVNSWVLVVLALFLGIAALLGVISKTLKTVAELAANNQVYQDQIAKLMKISLSLTAVIVAMVMFKTI